MMCPKCNEQTNSIQFCTVCGASYSEAEKQTVMQSGTTFDPVISAKSKGNLMKVVRVVVGIAAIGFLIYTRLDDTAIQKNNDALTSYNEGNSSAAIAQFEAAVNSAITDETKVSALKNLAYVYLTNGNNEQALESFSRALAITKPDTFDNYLISAEIALINKDGAEAEKNYLSAYALDPESFQINNALGLFYLDLDEAAPETVSPEKALPYIEKAYKENPAEYVKLNLGIAYFFNEKYDDAITLLKTSDLTNQPYASLWLGLAYLKKEDEPNATIAIKKAKELGVEIPESLQKYLE